MSDIMVSIICNTFNHEKFIKDALQGFVKQKAPFQFEVLIHDDASTDNTRKIIHEYELKYPGIIKPIYQKENQYSKKVPITQSFQLPRARGRYIAICEGDDYWIDENKLRIQVDYMENHPECSMICHSGYYADENNRKLPGMFRIFNESRIVSTNEVINTWICPTASILYRKKSRETSRFPKLNNAPCGDYPLIINLSLMGTIYYIDKPMSVYRRNSQSVSFEWDKNSKKKLDVNRRFISMLEEINQYTNGQYEKEINNMILIKEFNSLIINGDFESAKNEKYQDILRINRRSYIVAVLGNKTPKILKLYRSIKKALWSVLPHKQIDSL